MTKRKIAKRITGQQATDGAGVRLVRVLGPRDVYDFDPFLMLDSFDSTEPSDYTAGFPMHPHRGIETVTYLISGEIEHQDSLGNGGVILAGESQWMTGGSGILHQEMPIASERMLGFQLWVNLPKDEKMAPPDYLSITDEMIGRVEKEGALIRVLSGELDGVKGVRPRYVAATILDVSLEPSAEIEIETKPDDTAFVFLIEGEGEIEGEVIAQKTAVLFGPGDCVSIKAKDATPLRFAFFSAKPLKEEIAWGGPIVMNTREELNLAFEELRRGTFIKHG